MCAEQRLQSRIVVDYLLVLIVEHEERMTCTHPHGIGHTHGIKITYLLVVAVNHGPAFHLVGPGSCILEILGLLGIETDGGGCAPCQFNTCAGTFSLEIGHSRPTRQLEFRQRGGSDVVGSIGIVGDVHLGRERRILAGERAERAAERHDCLST